MRASTSMVVNTHGELVIGSMLYALNPDLVFNEDLGHWVNVKGEYDEEANDKRPNRDKYKNYWFVLFLLLLCFVGLVLLLRYIFSNIS